MKYGEFYLNVRKPGIFLFYDQTLEQIAVKGEGVYSLQNLSGHGAEL